MLITDEIDDLRRHGGNIPEDAFAALVNRHINLVYSSALRQVQDSHVAQEISQSVFQLLAQKASSIKKGTILTGWLYRTTRFVALERKRSENRRQIREKEAMERLYQSNEESPWSEIEPYLDEAMAHLEENDRNFVLLRFFENKSLREVGQAFGISEDAAQKRVARALEKLRSFFALRGTAVSAAALGTSLSTFGIQAAPVGLASLVLTTAAASSVAPVTLGILNFMASTKIKVAAVAGLLLAGASVPIVMQQRSLQQMRLENESLMRRVERVETTPQPPKAPVGRDVEIERLKREAAEVHKLRGEVGLLRRENQELTQSNPAHNSATDDGSQARNPLQRRQMGLELMAQGKHAEALKHFLWCFDEGLSHSPSFVGVRGSFLLSDLKELGKIFPPAQEALSARRDAAEEKVLAGASDPRLILDLVQLNANLEQPARTPELFDNLPENHPARTRLVDLAMEQFLAGKRYDEIVRAVSPETIFDRERNAMSRVGRQQDEMIQTAMRRRVVGAGAGAVEALAGAGENERAVALAEKILQLDSSPETRGELSRHAERAGNPEVISYLRNK